jgi:hypothetical protein
VVQLLTAPIIFIILIGSPEEVAPARLLIDSIRAYGGSMSHYPIVVFAADPENASCDKLQSEDVQVIPLELPEGTPPYYLRAKVYACARAEAMAGPSVQSLIWLNPDCLIIKPPVLLQLDESCDVAIRPVHIKNVGLGSDEPLDDYWSKVYNTVGLDPASFTVESFVDGQTLQPYFNTHLFAINPAKGLCRRWWEIFRELMLDADFQSGACSDTLHRIFLHQAVLSALLVKEVGEKRICILPPDYSYPYNLQDQIPISRRATTLNDMTCAVYEQRTLNPTEVKDINIEEPLRSWLTSELKGAK